MKKLFALILAVCLIGTILAGCGGRPSSAADSASSGSTAADSAKMPTVVITYMLPTIPSDQALVEEAMSAYAQEKLGVKIELQPVVMSDYTNQLNLLVAGDEQVDIAFIQNVSSMAAKGALEDMTGLLDEYGQEALNELGEYAKSSVIDGSTYAIPPIRNMGNQPGYMIRKDLAEQYDLDFSNVKTEKDLEPIFEKLKAAEPEMYVVANEVTGNGMMIETFDPLGDYFGVLMDHGKTLEVVDLFESDYFKETVELHRDWFNKGYIPSDILTSSETSQDLIRAGKLAGYYCTLKPGIEQEKQAKTGYEMISVPLDPPFVSSSKLSSMGWGILRNSADPVAAMKVLNMMYSDSDFINLLDWGIEGTHYIKVDGEENLITFPEGVDASNCGYYHAMNWMMGNQLVSYVALPETSDLWDRMRDFNDSALLSNAFGFTFDASEVKSEYTAVANVKEKYYHALTYGAIDPVENLTKFQEDLKAAGLQKIMDAKQAQLDAWKAG